MRRLVFALCALAARVDIAGQTRPELEIDALFVRVFGRHPRKEETAKALRFVEAAGADHESEAGLTPWEQLAQVLLISNEAVFLD